MIFKNKQESGEFKKDEQPRIHSEMWFRFLFVILLSLSVTSLMVLYIDRLPSNVFEGNIATKDIRADKNYNIVDIEGTNNLKEQAAQNALPVYNYDIELVNEEKLKVQNSFSKARQFIAEYFSQNPSQSSLPVEEVDKLKQSFLLNLGLALDDKDFNALYKDGFSEGVENALLNVYESVQKKPIIFDRSELIVRGDLGVIIREIKSKDKKDEEIVYEYEHIIALEDVQKTYEKVDISQLQKKLNLEFIEKSNIKLALKLLPIILKVNVSIDKIESEARRERALENVQSIEYKFKRGQIIIRRGEIYEQKHVTILDGIRKSRQQTNVILKFTGVFGLVLLTLLILFMFSKNIHGFKLTRRDLNFMGLLIVLFLAILRLGSFIGTSLQDSLPFSVDVSSFYYIIPVATGAMMVRFILTAEIALVYCFIISFFSGLFLELNYDITAYYFLSSVAAAHLIEQAERRSTVIRRGLYLGLVNILLVLSLNLISTISTASTVDLQGLFINCVFAFLAGPIVSLTLLAISPIMETVFNYTTNIQLLELANMNHPLLREMIVRAPGTYHHSQLVGILAEAGAREIGGNALLARVGSYYHDIGKMKKPQYFIENQKGDNPHDRLAPSMSALIIDAHVKDGVEMAREHKLPQVIADFIPEHQGTKLIGFFYHKALKEAEESGETIDERGYRYKGPRPQSRESGVVMLADTIEAAVRSMPDKSPQKIRAQVEKLVNVHFVDGQLDECELTLKDLHMIVDSFVKILIGIYHQRVEYPEDDSKKPISLVQNLNPDAKGSAHQSLSETKNISPLFKEKN